MDDHEGRLTIRLLGTPEVFLHGAPLALNHLKARALLFFLAATGERHTRDYLASLLWSESGPGEAHHSLRSNVYRLRHAIENGAAESVLVSDAEDLLLRPHSFVSDVIEFRRLVEQGDQSSLAQAVTLYRGPFLRGFNVPGANEFDEWVRAQDSYLSRACFRSLDQLTGSAEAGGEWSAALAFIQRMLEIDPLAEGVQQRLMRLYLRQGEVSSALRQYRRFESALRQEFGLEPSPETQALLRDALRQQPAPARPGSSTRTPHPTPLPFVGREQVVQELDKASQAALSGRGMTILIEGEGGIGKSRLLSEIAARLAGQSTPWMILQGACTPFDDLHSQGPFLEALELAAPGELGDLVAQAEYGVPDARGQFPWHVLQVIRSLCRNVPVVLMIEDLQWANSSTLNLFGFLAMRMHHLPVLLVGTVQQPEAIPALQRLIGLQRHRGELEILHLPPLKPGDISEILSASAISSTEALGEWLTALSAGNPFLLTEILAQLRAEGLLQLRGERWILDTIRWLQWRATFVLPETTHDLVAWRLANLDSNGRRILDVLAVAGQPLAEDVLQRFPDVTPSALPGWVDDLVARGLVLEMPGRQLALPHHLLRATLLHRLSSLRRRSIYRQLAEALEAAAVSAERRPAHQQNPDRLRLRQMALYAVAGEDVERARRYGLQVLTDLPQEYSGAQSIDFVQHLHDLLASSASPQEMVQITRTLGSLHQSVAHLEAAAHWHAHSLESARKAGDHVAQANAHFDMAELALMSNNYHTALTAAREGLSELAATGPGPDLDVALAVRGRGHRLLGAAFAMEGGNLPAAEQHLQEALGLHRRLGNHADLCATLFELGNIAAQRGQLQRALDLYDQSAESARVGHIQYYLALARNNFAYHSLLLGQADEAQRAVAEGIKVAEAHDLLAALLHLYSTRGEIRLYLADWDGAEDSFRRGLAIADELGSLERQAGYRGGLALAASGRQNWEEAIRLLRAGLDLIADQGYWHLRTRLQLWLADGLRHVGRHPEARELVGQAVEVSRAQARTVLLIQGDCLHARLLAEQGQWLDADALFAASLEAAAGLSLPLETARVQAAWGTTALDHAPDPEAGRHLIEDARQTFTASGALADLAQLPALDKPVA